MTQCNGQPAEKYALAYVEGSLQEHEVEQFQEHYFDCSICSEYVLELHRVKTQIGKSSIELPLPQRKAVQARRSKFGSFLLPAPVWGVLAFVSLLLIAIFVVRENLHKSDSTQQASGTEPNSSLKPNVQSGSHSDTPASVTPSRSPVTGSPAPNAAALLADLVVPKYVKPDLRDENQDPHFLAGMDFYSTGDYLQSVNSLDLVSSTSHQYRQAKFYSGACQLKLGNFTQAHTDLRVVIDAGDSPLREWAFYELAQTALAANDPSTAHSYLQQAIAQHGDLYERASAEDRKVLELLKSAQKTSPESSNK